jgi:membrane protein DedA with SNARE-associated domain
MPHTIIHEPQTHPSWARSSSFRTKRSHGPARNLDSLDRRNGHPRASRSDSPRTPRTDLAVDCASGRAGAAVAEGEWSLTVAFWSSTAGSLFGCLSFYRLGLILGEARSFAGLNGSARFFGVSQGRLRRLMVYFRRYPRTMVFGSQLIPSVRLIAPVIAGVLRIKPREFLMATAIGVALWNWLVIGVGYAAALTNDSANISAVALEIVLAVLVGEVVVASAWRGIVVRRARVDVSSRKSKAGIRTDARGATRIASMPTSAARRSHGTVHGDAKFLDRLW